MADVDVGDDDVDDDDDDAAADDDDDGDDIGKEAELLLLDPVIKVDGEVLGEVVKIVVVLEKLLSL